MSIDNQFRHRGERFTSERNRNRNIMIGIGAVAMTIASFVGINKLLDEPTLSHREETELLESMRAGVQNDSVKAVLVLEAGVNVRKTADLESADNNSGEGGNLSKKIKEGESLVIVDPILSEDEAWYGFTLKSEFPENKVSKKEAADNILWVSSSVLEEGFGRIYKTSEEKTPATMTDNGMIIKAESDNEQIAYAQYFEGAAANIVKNAIQELGTPG